MQRLFRLIRKKRNQTRFLAVFFLFCLVVEIFSHAQQGVEILIAELLPSNTKVCVVDNDDSDKTTAAPISCTEKQDDDHPFNAGDQLNHHQVLTVAFDFPQPVIEQSFEKILSQFDSPVYNSLPPPYLPPELS